MRYHPRLPRVYRQKGLRTSDPGLLAWRGRPGTAKPERIDLSTAVCRPPFWLSVLRCGAVFFFGPPSYPKVHHGHMKACRPVHRAHHGCKGSRLVAIRRARAPSTRHDFVTLALDSCAQLRGFRPTPSALHLLHFFASLVRPLISWHLAHVCCRGGE